jgi:hypothetical protein
MNYRNFLAGCNRFGLDNPCPTITKRLAIYGNLEDLDKDIKKMVNAYKNLYPKISEIKDINLSILST